MERELNSFLYDLCVKWGFCIPTEDRNVISKSEYYRAKDFAHDVIEAEGMNAEHEPTWVKKISNKFIERFGSNEIDASSFADRVRSNIENWN
ncbi:hypothetical protein [Reichenbachiella sp.]|uniref:hypothetical protein n=1 Tax=Reichenbachiella sp. TaxID=2184521 RepID=UPI003BAE8C2F